MTNLAPFSKSEKGNRRFPPSHGILCPAIGWTFLLDSWWETTRENIFMVATLDHAISEPDRIPRRRWAIACLLGFGVLVNYFDRVNLSVSKDALTAAFGISAVTFGYLSSAYNWTYAALQLPSGLLLDKFGVRRVGRLSTILWAVASFGAAISTGLGGFLAARLLLGIGEAPRSRRTPKPSATGFQNKNAASLRRFLTRWQNFLPPSECRCSASCFCILAGDGVSRRQASSASSILFCSTRSTETRAKTSASRLRSGNSLQRAVHSRRTKPGPQKARHSGICSANEE